MVKSVKVAEVRHGADDHHHVPPGYQAAILIGWGDSLTDGTATADLAGMTPEEQSVRFGTNCDYTAGYRATAKRFAARIVACESRVF